jgi:CheY-like chemotaxis protein
VLLVDDDPIVAGAIGTMLENLGHVVVDANSAEDALRKLQSEPAIDIVVTDQAMPDITGSQLTAEIARRWPDLPVVLVSGYRDVPGSGDRNLPRLSKPFRLEELAWLLETLSGDRPRAASLSQRILAGGDDGSRRAGAAATSRSISVGRHAVIGVDAAAIAPVRPVRQSARSVARRSLQPAAIEIEHVSGLIGVVVQQPPGQRMIAFAHPEKTTEGHHSIRYLT